jgi:hypothetical protein
MDDSDLDSGLDSGDHSPDQSQPVGGHGYDAVFFIIAFLVAIGFVVVLAYFKG